MFRADEMQTESPRGFRTGKLASFHFLFSSLKFREVKNLAQALLEKRGERWHLNPGLPESKKYVLHHNTVLPIVYPGLT